MDDLLTLLKRVLNMATVIIMTLCVHYTVDLSLARMLCYSQCLENSITSLYFDILVLIERENYLPLIQYFSVYKKRKLPPFTSIF